MMVIYCDNNTIFVCGDQTTFSFCSVKSKERNWNILFFNFYGATAELAMQSPVLATIRLSIPLSVCDMLALSQNDTS